MILTIFSCLDKNDAMNKNVLSSLASLEQSSVVLEFIFATGNVSPDKLKNLDFTPFPDAKFYENPFDTYQEAYNHMADMATGDYFTVANCGDKLSANFVTTFEKGLAEYPDHNVYMASKIFPNGTVGALRTFRSREIRFEKKKEFYPIDLTTYFSCIPYDFPGNFINMKSFKERKLNLALGLEAERDFMLRFLTPDPKTVFFAKAEILSNEYEENDFGNYMWLYSKDWYYGSFTNFWQPFFKELEENLGDVPLLVKYTFMQSVRCRFNANKDNRNKGVIGPDEVEKYFEFIGEQLKLIDIASVFNAHAGRYNNMDPAMGYMYGILREGKDFKFDVVEHEDIYYLAVYGTPIKPLLTMNTNLKFLDFRDGKLEIDGELNPVIYNSADEVFIRYDGEDYPLTYNDRYGTTKVFGVSAFKVKGFHVSLPFKDKPKTMISCIARFGEIEANISFKMNSHFSRVCRAFGSSHYVFGDKRQYMMYANEDGIITEKVGFKKKFIKELKLAKDMWNRDEETRSFLYFRELVRFARPFVKRKPIWFYIDKIYKGGDSSEYIYKYAVAQKDGNKHYYLIDKNSADYKRLKREGYKPLVRGSLKHRVLFLLSDMMVISNSTVFAFNGYNMQQSAYVRDLHDFHVCCVQHGMSIQKIAVAQNRLRDNTRLYFCASKYEIENLTKPVYDYEGYDALKLTGVPRYDGLVDRHEKQIMISPTWRMQAAVPVSLSKSEGEQRDYNPLFKETDYFKIYNSLINDPRLIEAAKEHGYRIKYVLHPIVSSQVEDFQKNDFVDIVPAVGDMSYEDMFCESALMVTDFSGIQFDFAYMRKPVVYLHHKDIPQHYEEGTFHYDTMAFGEICHDNDELIDQLIEYMENDCVMKPEFVARADDFFHFDDHNNCERIYKEMVEYQNKYILKKK